MFNRNRNRGLSLVPRKKKSWKPLWWLVGSAAGVTLFTLAFWLGEVHILPYLTPKTHIFEQEVWFEKPTNYHVTADLPWRGNYQLVFYLSSGQYPCDKGYLRQMLGDFGYRSEDKPAHRGVDWPLSWEVRSNTGVLAKDNYSRDLYWGDKTNAAIGPACSVYRKLAVIDAAEATLVNINLDIAQVVAVPANTRFFVILRLDKPASKFVQIMFLAGPALGLFSALFWRGYGFLWLWGSVGVVVLLVLVRRHFYPDES